MITQEQRDANNSRMHAQFVKETYNKYKAIFNEEVLHLNNLARAIYLWNKYNGFWDEPRSFNQAMELVRSEKFEGFEIARKKGFDLKATSLAGNDAWMHLHNVLENKEEYEQKYKNSYQTEVADMVIRLLDYWGMLLIEYRDIIPIGNTDWQQTYVNSLVEIPLSSYDNAINDNDYYLDLKELYNRELIIVKLEIEIAKSNFVSDETHFEFLAEFTNVSEFLHVINKLILNILMIDCQEGNLESMQAKLYYNLLRPYKHGKNF